MSDTLRDLLGRALEAFERRAEEEALQHLLEAWRESHSKRIAALVEKVSARLTAGLPPLECEPFSPAMRRRRPVDLPRMFGGLMEAANRGLTAALVRQLEALCEWPADPRLVPVLLAIAPMPVAVDRRVLRALQDLFLHLRDPSTTPAFRAVLGALESESTYAEQLALILKLYGVQEVPSLEDSPDAKALALCESLDADIDARGEADARRGSLRQELFARVYSRPDDDSARLVLADHLLEQDDPLGEFIMLQCSPCPDKARIEALLEKYWEQWQAPLGPLIQPEATRFERGFPIAVQMRFGQQQPPPGPAWGTVREISWKSSVSPLAANWLASPHLHAVTRMRGMHPAIARRLGAYPLAVRRLELQGGPPFDEDTFTALSSLPHLCWVDISDADARAVGLCASSPMARRLECFTASRSGVWLLTATPSAAVTVEVMVRAPMRNEPHWELLAEAIRAAVGFGNRALRLRCERRLEAWERRLLAIAGAAYARVEWA